MPMDKRRSESHSTRIAAPAKPLWEPSQARIAGANVTAFARAAIREWNLKFNTYPDFYRWTVECPEQFWLSLWRYAGVKSSARGERVLAHGERMPVRFSFTGTPPTLNSPWRG